MLHLFVVYRDEEVRTDRLSIAEVGLFGVRVPEWRFGKEVRPFMAQRGHRAESGLGPLSAQNRTSTNRDPRRARSAFSRLTRFRKSDYSRN
jgi:hypothetical protein